MLPSTLLRLSLDKSNDTQYHLCMADPDLLMQALERGGHRLTEPRRQVAALITVRRGYFSAADLVDDARGQRAAVGRATVFRTLELLADVGAIERIDLPTGEHAYVACEPAHHHHLVCSSCGCSVEVVDGDLAKTVERIGRRTGYRIDSHRLEVYGLCPACQARGAAQT